MKKGFTLIEVVLSVAIMAVLGIVAVVSLTGKKSSNDLGTTVSQVTALLHEAESRSVTQVQGVSWGIHFSNATATTPFYALFFSSYSPTTTVSYYRLPTDVAYVPSTLPVGTTLDLVFSQVSGLASASTTIGFFNTARSSLSSGIGVAASGAISAASISVTGPSISSISPNATTTGAAQFTLTVNGALFSTSTAVQWNGSALTTTFVSSSSLTAVVPAADVATAGTASVTAWSPSGGSSNSKTFTINNPLPTTTSIAPNATTTGGSQFTLTVNGTNFVGGSIVQWNGSALTTTFVSSSSLTAVVPAASIASGGTVPVTVMNYAPGGGTSNSQTFTINNPS
jgi:prepilin-type N-terminal cleavage/methylation domain-containing protein